MVFVLEAVWVVEQEDFLFDFIMLEKGIGKYTGSEENENGLSV